MGLQRRDALQPPASGGGAEVADEGDGAADTAVGVRGPRQLQAGQPGRTVTSGARTEEAREEEGGAHGGAVGEWQRTWGGVEVASGEEETRTTGWRRGGGKAGAVRWG